MRKSPQSFIAFAVLPLLASASACGGAEAPAQTPAAAASSAPPMQLIDLSPVPEPPTLVVSGRLTNPASSLQTVHGWTKLPMPQSEQMTELLTNEALGPLVNMDLPIDFAVTVTGSGTRLAQEVAASAAVKDPEKAKASLAEHYKLVPADNGVLLLQPQNGGAHPESGEAGEGAHACELTPSYGVAQLRVVCASSPKALTELAPWLARSAPRSSERADLHIDLRMKPLQSTIQGQKRFAAMLLGTVLGARVGTPALRDLGVAFGTDLMDLASDLDTASLDVALGGGGAQAELKLRLAGSTSAIGHIATSHPDRTGPVPAAFWQLPADADFGFFGRGVDEADVAKGRELVLHAVGDAMGEEGVKDADRKPILDALAKLVSPAAMVYASGVDVDAVRKAIAAEKALDAKPDAADREETKRQAIEELLGWHVLERDEPAANVVASLKELSAALGKPSVAAGFREKLKEAPPSLRLVPSSRAGLPAGTAHYVLELHTMDRKASTPSSTKKPLGPLKPIVLHIFVAPEAQRTWLAVGGDEAAVATRLAQALGSSGEGLAGRSDLAALKAGNVGSGGFFTLRGLPEGAHQLKSTEEAMALPHQGTTPIVFSTTAQAGGPPAVTVSHLVVPRDAIEDVVTLVMKHSGG